MYQKKSYRFLLPQVASEPLGTQGEIAKFIPYRLDEGITPESILEELRSQPHFKALADKAAADTRIAPDHLRPGTGASPPLESKNCAGGADAVF